MAFRKILIPLDGSELAEKAIEKTKSLCKCEKDTQIILLRVVEQKLIGISDSIGADRFAELQQKYEKEAEDYMKQKEKELRNESIQTKIIIERGTDPAEKILEIAKTEGADLIAMSSHGKSKVLHWVFGSVAHRVLSHTSIPVLVIVPEERKANY